MSSQLHITHGTMTSYHPESNGLVECLHKTLKAALRAKCQAANWSAELPLILLGLQSAPRESDAILSFERTFGIPQILPGDFWCTAETPNQEFLTDFQRAIENYSAPRTTPNRLAVPAMPLALTSCRFITVDGVRTTSPGPSLHWSFQSPREI